MIDLTFKVKKVNLSLFSMFNQFSYHKHFDIQIKHSKQIDLLKNYEY